MPEKTIINANQERVLKAIVSAGGRQPMKGNYDVRTVGALETRGLVKRTESKKGIFVSATQKGKRLVN